MHRYFSGENTYLAERLVNLRPPVAGTLLLVAERLVNLGLRVAGTLLLAAARLVNLGLRVAGTSLLLAGLRLAGRNVAGLKPVAGRFLLGGISSPVW